MCGCFGMNERFWERASNHFPRTLAGEHATLEALEILNTRMQTILPRGLHGCTSDKIIGSRVL